MTSALSPIDFLETLREKLGFLNALIYVRQSWEEDGTLSPEIQENECTKFALGHRIDVVEVVRDIDLSGGTFDKRKVAEIISRVGDGEANIVLVLYRNRFGRSNQNDAYEAELNRVGGTLISVKNPLDPNTPAGRQGIEVDNFVSVMTRRNISESWRNTHRNRKGKQLPHAGCIRFGYDPCPDCTKEEFVTQSGRKRSRYVKCEKCRLAKGRPQTPNPVTGKALQEFCKRWTWDGESAKKLAREMANRGIRSRRGHVMTPANWLSVLDTGFAAGYLRSRKVPVGTTGMPKLYKGNKIDSFDVWEEGAHDAVIEPKLWEAYKKKRKLSQGSHPPRDTDRKYPLVGFLKCGRPLTTEEGNEVIDQDGNPVLCMRPMYKTFVGRRGKTIDIYYCSGKDTKVCDAVTIALDRAHKLTVNWLEERAQGEGVLAEEVARLTATRKKAKQAKEKAAEVELLTNQLHRLTDDRSAGLVSDFAYKLSAPGLETKILAAQKMCDQYTKEAQYEESPPPKVFKSIAEMWEKADFERKHQLLSPVLSHIIAHKTPERLPTRLEFVPRWAA